jgi:hypothetical protein
MIACVCVAFWFFGRFQLNLNTLCQIVCRIHDDSGVFCRPVEHFQLPSLMGATMAIGVATANSILVASFANDECCRKQNASLGRAVIGGFRRSQPTV